MRLRPIYEVIPGVVRTRGLSDPVPFRGAEPITQEIAKPQEVLIEDEFTSNLVVLRGVEIDPIIYGSRKAAKRLLQEVLRELVPSGPTPPFGLDSELPQREDPEVIVSRTMKRIWTFVEEHIHEPWIDDVAFTYAMIPTVQQDVGAFLHFTHRMIEVFPDSTGNIQLRAYLQGFQVNPHGYTWK
ncbi:MAG: hypothetical protein ACI8X5_001938 [Planctomycetota bacterium]